MYRSNSTIAIASPWIWLCFALQTLTAQMNVLFPLWAFHHNHRYSVNSSLGPDSLQISTKSQSGEDIWAWKHYFCRKSNGRFLEMGALDGLLYSNTYALEKEANWRGVLIEANPTSFGSLKTNRPDNILVNAAICQKTQLVHYIDKGNPCCTGIFEFMSPSFVKTWHSNLDLSTTTVLNCHPLTDVLKVFSHNLKHINLFSLDVEGAEYEVLKSINFEVVTFDLIIVEADRSNVEKDTNVRNLLEKNGYSFVNNEGRSDWFKRAGWTPTPC